MGYRKHRTPARRSAVAFHMYRPMGPVPPPQNKLFNGISLPFIKVRCDKERVGEQVRVMRESRKAAADGGI